jgi:hypothetical protein
VDGKPLNPNPPQAPPGPIWSDPKSNGSGRKSDIVVGGVGGKVKDDGEQEEDDDGVVGEISLTLTRSGLRTSRVSWTSSSTSRFPREDAEGNVSEEGNDDAEDGEVDVDGVGGKR